MPTRTPASRTVASILIVTGLLGATPALNAQTTEDAKLVSSDGVAGDRFGSAVATDGALVAVGAPHASAAGIASGAAYLSHALLGTQTHKLVPSAGGAGDQFGAAIAMDGARVVVGAPLADAVGVDSGAAYVFDVATGLERLKLVPSDAAAGDRFGLAVAIDRGLIVVGSGRSAYVFDASTGQQVKKLVPTGQSITLGMSGFGGAVDIDDGLIVVGARLENGVSGFAGATYLFDAATGQQLHRLVALNGTVWAFFGASVAIDGDVIAVGAPEADPDGKQSGAAYAFDAATGQQVHYFFPADGHVFANFGSSVDVAGDDLFVGAAQNNAGGLFSSGSVYRYDAQSGAALGKLVASDAAANDELGGALSVVGGVLIAGAAQDDDLGNASGSAYAFDLDPVWSSHGKALSGTYGAPSLMGAGSLMSLTPVTLSLSDALENSTAYLIIGLSEINAPFQGGILVPNPGPPGVVFALPTGPTGEISLSATWPSGVPSGVSMYFQYWIVDAAGPFGLSASNAVSGTTP